MKCSPNGPRPKTRATCSPRLKKTVPHRARETGSRPSRPSFPWTPTRRRTGVLARPAPGSDRQECPSSVLRIHGRRSPVKRSGACSRAGDRYWASSRAQLRRAGGALNSRGGTSGDRGEFWAGARWGASSGQIEAADSSTTRWRPRGRSRPSWSVRRRPDSDDRRAPRVRSPGNRMMTG